MGSSIRLRKHKHRAMARRLKGGKKPMSPEQKEARKKISETQRKEALEANALKAKSSKKVDSKEE